MNVVVEDHPLIGHTCRHRGATGTVHGPLLFFFHINDLSETGSLVCGRLFVISSN